MKKLFRIIMIICFILLLIFIFLYFLKFNNLSKISQKFGIENFFAMFSNYQEDWGNFGDYIGGLLAFFSIIILLYIHFNEKDFRQAETFDNLVKEYSSKEFHNELKKLDRFRKSVITKYNKKEVIKLKKKLNNLYIKILPEKIIEYKNSVSNNTYQNYNDSRRIVSNFFQRMSILLKKSYLKKDLVLSFWGKDHSLLLENLIIPFENSLLKNLNNSDKGLDEKDINNRLKCLIYIKDKLNIKIIENDLKSKKKNKSLIIL